MIDEQTGVDVVSLAECSNLLLASALILSMNDAMTDRVSYHVSTWGIPLFIIQDGRHACCSPTLIKLSPTLLQWPLSEADTTLVINASRAFESSALPPFSSAIAEFVSRKRPTMACPGHQGGLYLDLHPAGVRLKQMLGKGIFAVDVPHAAPELGDVLSHEGPIKQAEDLAAKVFNADETYFVLNGTSTANKIVTSALLTAGELVLMDRNNHKSVYLGALVQSGARAVFLDNFRDDCGVLGGYRKGALQENELRARAAKIDSVRACRQRPFRLAIVQHATCDGVVVDAGELLKRIGHLCDYVLFDSAWLGYEPFVDLLASKSPLRTQLSADDPGIIVTQSVHKQMSGLSQTSQIHKKDNHIRGQQRYCSSHVFNSAFMLHSSTSPFYPLFMSLEVNAAIHANGNGQRLWNVAVCVASEFKKQIEQRCRVIKPYYGDSTKKEPVQHDDNASSSYPGNYRPVSHTDSQIEEGLHYLDPCKVILTTKASEWARDSINISIPASIVTYYLREMNYTPEKSDFYNMTLLISPSTETRQLTMLAHTLEQLEQYLADGRLVTDVLPSLASTSHNYANISLRKLCNNINKLFQSHQIEKLQSELFSSVKSAKTILTPFAANQFFLRGCFKLISLADALGCVAAEGVIPYPPGVMCIAPGERWTTALVEYLMGIQALVEAYPEFAPHLQGVYYSQDNDGGTTLKVNVLNGVTF